MGTIDEDNRRYPLKRPKNHKIPMPRWILRMPDHVSHIYTLYIGVQYHRKASSNESEQQVQKWLDDADGLPIAVDTFRVTNGFDIVDSKVWVAYWTDVIDFETKLKTLDLKQMWDNLGNDKASTGLWCEYFRTPIERLETNYASLLHRPGIAQVPGGEFPEHDLTGYWGAGRDRLPGSASDLFLPPDKTPAPQEAPKGFGEQLTGKNYENMCHIRKYRRIRTPFDIACSIDRRKRPMVDSV
jgi:hypothetical protein